MNSLLEHLNNYCERTGEGLWSEPLNAVSNVAFFIAAWMLWKEWKQQPFPTRSTAILIALIALVGTGSTLFHTFANRLTMIGDIVPIGLLTFYYLWVVLRTLIGASRILSLVYLGAFTAVAALTSHIAPAYSFNGSVAYFPCLGALLVIVAVIRTQHPAASLCILRASLWFMVSLTCRSLDLTLCPLLPLGTHFLWHCMNGWVLYLLVKALMKPTASIN